MVTLGFKGLTSHWTHNWSWRRWIFPGNRLHWYWQPQNKKTKHYTHPKHKRELDKKYASYLDWRISPHASDRISLSHVAHDYPASLSHPALWLSNALSIFSLLALELTRGPKFTKLGRELQPAPFHHPAKFQSNCTNDLSDAHYQVFHFLGQNSSKDLLPTQVYHLAKFHRPVSTHAGDICYRKSVDKQTQKQ